MTLPPVKIYQVEIDECPQARELFPEPAGYTLDEVTIKLPAGVYTTFRTYEKFFALHLEDHLRRLEHSSELSGVKLNINWVQIREILRNVLGNQTHKELRVRIIVGLASNNAGKVFILVERLKLPRRADYRNGVCLITRQMYRSNPEAKLTQFIESTQTIRDQIPSGVNEILMVKEDGLVLEGLSSNFFAIHNGKILTAQTGVLPGITRSIILAISEELAIPIEFDKLLINDIQNVSEAFISSTSRGVLPVRQIDQFVIGTTCPGIFSQMIRKKFNEQVQKEILPI